MAQTADTSATSYTEPKRFIFVESDLNKFVASSAYKELINFTRILSESVKGIRVSDDYPVSDAVKSTLNLLDTLDKWVDEFPPIQQPMRFGNKAYRSWYDQLCKESPALMASILPEAMKPAVIELMAYWNDSFGNRTRIDYGTGHETCFVIWLLCLYKLGFFVPNDFPALVLRVFNRYIILMRRMQVEYMLEPAGSHGVWGLDDYQCLVFLFGSAQLFDHPDILPASIHQEDVLVSYSDEYLYLAAIKFIREVKAGSPFAETSPMLNDISGVPYWEKVNQGMLKLYQGEVLKKLPVIQHLRFGSLFKATWTPSHTPDTSPAEQHPVETTVPWVHEGNRDMPGVCVSGTAPWATPAVPSDRAPWTHTQSPPAPTSPRS